MHKLGSRDQIPNFEILDGGQPSFYNVFLYRATLCVSTVFAVARCLPDRLSVTFVHSIQTAEI